MLCAQVNDQFSDGDYTNNPAWTTGATDFTVNAGKLQSANTTSNTSFYIATSSTVTLNSQWEFWCNLQFNPSSANYVDAYLVSDNINLQAAGLNGYFVRLGNTTDDICLYRQTAGTPTKIIDGVDGLLNTSSSTFRIKVTRDATNTWELKRDMGGTGLNYISEGTVTDGTFTTGSCFGFLIRQSTPSFFQKHFFDDVYAGPIIIDTSPPVVVSASLLNPGLVDLLFDEPVELNSAQTNSNYTLSPNNCSITSVAKDATDPRLVHIATTGFVSGTQYTITVSNVQDLSGNAISHGNVVFSYYRPRPYDVVFNEIMPDPDPPVNLPNAEYIELKNRTPFTINLKNWRLSSLSSVKKLPAITLLPDSFVVLTGTGNASLFAAQGITTYDITSLPSLINSGTTLCLRDSNGAVIHSIAYNTTWYNDASKTNGGWSMEEVDANNPCGGQNNWHASTNSNGGTPGRKNSVAATHPDLSAPELARIYVNSADSIVLVFSEPADSVSLLDPATYSFDQGLPQPIAVVPLGPGFTHVKLKLSTAIQAGIVYHCTVTGNTVSDCAGNMLQAGKAVPFALPETAVAGDIIINEVLFNPRSGGYDFVELYNRSQKTIDLGRLRIGSMDTLTGMLKDTKSISTDGYLLFPSQYIVLSESGATVKQHYGTMNTEGFIDLPVLPAMNVDNDVVTLSDAGGSIIDNLAYTDNMHFPLLTDRKGVSLERIDFNRPTNDRSNWNSAAQQVGFATPAYRNSQYMVAEGGSGVSVNNSIFSPDNDGYQDVLDISYAFDEPGKSGNLFIYDSKGRQVRHLLRNEQLLQTGTVSWNGITDHNDKAPIGLYVVYFEVFNTKGTVSTYKLGCVLAGKL